MQPNGGIRTKQIIAEMAEVIVTLGEGCTEQEVRLAGKYTEDQVKLFGARATELATVMARAA
ncbi:hypothetical protein GOC32_29010 [Sinorhizobium meliloti]|nr:hypothetical protein [Sinorhizobium meliloti]